MTVRLITLSLRQVLRLVLLTCRSSRSKDLELLVLRQELAVLRRRVPHPKTRREERLVLTVLQRLRPVRERLSNLFTPDTLRRWHRCWRLRCLHTTRQRSVITHRPLSLATAATSLA